MPELIGKKIHISGIVQGVGFRPFVYAAAQEFNITGWVCNSSAGVDIVANGKEANLHQFISKLKRQPPPLSKIDQIEIQDIPTDGFEVFRIVKSQSFAGDFVPISPDVSICEDCSRELFDPADRRYRYPFINCTNCGPRFTIIQDIPYDRPYTTMADFALCPACRAEYENPIDRRFHAQPVACPECGPRIWFETKDGRKSFNEEGLQLARNWLRAGKIIAVKGLGGFHLVCNAHNAEAIQKLRERKKRSDKAFAVMVFSTSIAKKYCHIRPAELRLLESREKPIVILDKKADANLPPAIAPHKNTLGVMLPYTPLHLLLLEPASGYPEVLVMTSGNISEEPIAYTNNSAKEHLHPLVDAYLFNNRNIHTRVDDSVITVFDQQFYFLRRARGYAPNPIRMPFEMGETLAVGAALKNTYCLTKRIYAFISHHIGDLENLETLQAFEQGIDHFEKLFRIQPTLIAHDLHPDYLSTQYAQERSTSESIATFPVQHHHAHLASCLADNHWNSTEPVLGICFDGTGYGTDGKIWGGEFLLGNYKAFERIAHLAYMPLPGGDAAILQPRRIAAAYLWSSGVHWTEEIPAIQAFKAEELKILRTQLEKGVNCPQTSSMGRLFDAVASIIGVRHTINYEGQAAIEMESIADPAVEEYYDLDLVENKILLNALLSEIVKDLLSGAPVAYISTKFHNTIAQMVTDISVRMQKSYGFHTIALSGGVWQNLYLLKRTVERLRKTQFNVLIHRQVPTNDGGISLGQALIANQNKS